MSISLVPEKIAEDMKLEVNDSCRCCITFVDRPVYVNKYAEVESFKKEKAKGDENRRSLQRMETFLQSKIATYSDDVDLHITRLQDLAKINFQLMQAHDIKLTSKKVTKINKAIDQLAIELAASLKESPNPSPPASGVEKI